DAGAGLGVGEGLVVLQRDVEVAADVREARGEEVPRLPREDDGAEEIEPGRTKARGLAAGLEHPPVESRVVGGEELRPIDEGLHLRPSLREAGGVLDVLPA